MFFGHAPELVMVLVVALAIFGPKRLPEIGSSLGKGIRAFRTATTEMQDVVTGAPVQDRVAAPERDASVPLRPVQDS